VLTAADGLEAVEVFERHRELVDLVVLDWTMPRMTGGQVLETILRLRPDARVIVSTGGTAHGSERPEGVLGILPKPYTATALRQVVAQALRGEAAAPGGT
jgi:CheY-like chemotaxis protein